MAELSLHELAFEGVSRMLMDSIEQASSVDTLFREDGEYGKFYKMWNSFVHHFADEYVKDTLGPAIKKVSKSQPLVENIWAVLSAIINSMPPVEVRKMLHLAYEKIQSRQWDAIDGISSLFFLRFICPAILIPENWGMPKEDSRRDILKHITSIIQKMAVQRTFDNNDERADVNDFIRLNTIKIQWFIYQITQWEEIPDDIQEWKTCHTHEWLRQSGYHQYLDKFNMFDGSDVVAAINNRFSAWDLPQDHRRGLVKSLKKWAPVSSPRLKGRSSTSRAKTMTIISPLSKDKLRDACTRSTSEPVKTPHTEPNGTFRMLEACKSADSLPRTIVSWNAVEVANWLDSMRWGQYKELFQGVDGCMLLELSQDEFEVFKDTMVSGHRRHMTNAVKRWPNWNYRSNSINSIDSHMRDQIRLNLSQKN